tara:strand:- start:766 stop:948 length:183 start_codon:yes stop_codon:yes gene_type:complete
MVEVFLMQSLLIMIPMFMAISAWLFMDIVLDVMDSLSEKKVVKVHNKEEPIDKTKEYFNI